MTSANSQGKWLLSGIMLVIIIVIGVMVYEPNTQPRIPAITPATDPAGNSILGSEDAPVAMIIFGDYECPYCKKAFDEVENRIRAEYVETGKVKMVFRDFPLDSIHSYARLAAGAAECADDQGKYWQYHDALFARQSSLPSLDFTKLAGELGLDTATFKNCLTTAAHDAEINKDAADGRALGVTATPATFINGSLILGAYPYETYSAEIEKALRRATGSW